MFCDRAFIPDENDPKRSDQIDRGDITESPAWQLADEEQRSGLKRAAGRFLLSQKDSDRKPGQRTNFSQAAYYAITLLGEALSLDQALRVAVIQQWPNAMFDEFYHGHQSQPDSLAAVTRLLPEQAINRLSELLDWDNCQNGQIRDLSGYSRCGNPGIVEAIRRFISDSGVKARSIRLVFKFLSSQEPSSALLLFDELLSRRGGYQRLDEDGRALLGVALFQLPYERWSSAWQVLLECPQQIGRQVFLEAMNDLLFRDTRFKDKLDAGELTELCELVLTWFPSPEFSAYHDEQGHVSCNHMIPELRDLLIADLVGRSTSEACDGLRRLVAIVPQDQQIWMRWRLNEAIRNALRRAWTGRSRTTADLLTMMQNARALTIDTVDDLYTAVLTSLERLQERLKVAESPQLHALWNEPGQGKVPTPKDEEVFSNVMHDWLQRDLGAMGGIVLNREVQATRLGKLDIKVEAFSARGGPILTLVIENKGDWNREIETGLGRQLVNGYLIPNRWTHGIYVVAWFGPKRSQRSRAAWPPATLVEAENMVKTWEKGQCPLGLKVKALIVDCSFPSSLRGRRL